MSYGDPHECLCDMNAKELLSVRIEAYGVVALKNPSDLIPDAGPVDFHGPQNAVKAEDKLRASNFGADVVEGLLKLFFQSFAAGNPQYEPLLDGAKEGQASVGIDLLDGSGRNRRR